MIQSIIGTEGERGGREGGKGIRIERGRERGEEEGWEGEEEGEGEGNDNTHMYYTQRLQFVSQNSENDF